MYARSLSYCSGSIGKTNVKETLCNIASLPQLDQGVASNQKFAILGDLTLDGAGNVAGSEVFRTAVTSLWSSVTGTYTMSSPQSGTLTLTLDQGDGDSAPMTHNYRFLITGDNELLAIRPDSGVFSVCTLSPELVSPNKGSFAFSELESNGNGRNLTMLAKLALDGNGAVAGSAVSLNSAGSADATISGTYAAPAKGLGTLAVSLTTKDSDGVDQTSVQNYRTAATRDGVKAIRMDPGIVSVASFDPQ